jgi:signal transduction histidine kinase
MKFRIFSLRWKIVALFGVSIFLALASVSGLIQIVHRIGVRDRSSTLYLTLKDLQTRIGVIPLGAVAGFAFFIIFFFLLSRGSIIYLEKVSRALQRVSLGNLDIEIPVRSRDELGELGESVNRMASRLKASLQEERGAERSKNELITGVSHDLRTPLTSILGYLELIGQARDMDPDTLRRYAGVALQKSRQMKSLIDDLFEYTKIQDGGAKFRPGRIDLRELLTQLAEEFVPAFQVEGRTLRLTGAEKSYPVRADGDLIVRAFENLLSNAIRHGIPGGGIDLDLSREGPWTVARVSNSGPPISPEDLPRVFDRFFRGDDPRSEKSGGAGLGLAIVKSIVDRHGGEIAVRSDESRTVFEVRLKSDP